VEQLGQLVLLLFTQADTACSRATISYFNSFKPFF